VRGILFVVSGPSGAGKGTVCRALTERLPKIHLSVSATTRPARSGEIDQVHYYFVSRTDFQDRISRGEMLEWADVYGDYYGTPREPVDRILDQGQDVILEIDVQGALQVRGRMPEAVLLFLSPPSFAELERRLRNRGTDTEEKIEKRLNWAHRELNSFPSYDYVVINDRVEAAVEKIMAVMVAERCRTKRFQLMDLNPSS
jgi:guanylate kinase